MFTIENSSSVRLGMFGSGSTEIGTPSGGDLGTGALNLEGNLYRGGTQVITARQTGWTAPTGTPTRTGFATSTPPSNTVLAEHLKALIDDLITHGVIGA
jgi:hypothetical protein